MSDYLKRRIDKARAQKGAETGDITAFSVWMREAAEEKLEREATTTQTENGTQESEEGTRNMSSAREAPTSTDGGREDSSDDEDAEVGP
jgi:hypothetical protein